MKEYLLTLVAAALTATLFGILSPDGERGGIAKHMRLLTSLFLVCVLIAPLGGALTGLRALINGELSLPSVDQDSGDGYRDLQDAVLDDASVNYFTDLLNETVARQFSIASDEVRCSVEWTRVDGRLDPVRVTVILSGRAIWQDPHAIEAFVEALLGCECVTAIE